MHELTCILELSCYDCDVHKLVAPYAGVFHPWCMVHDDAAWNVMSEVFLGFVQVRTRAKETTRIIQRLACKRPLMICSMLVQIRCARS